MGLCLQQVRERAYFIWEAEGYAEGRAEAHWLRAECELGNSGEVAGAKSSNEVLPVNSTKPRARRAKVASPDNSAAKPASKARTRSGRNPASESAALT